MSLEQNVSTVLQNIADAAQRAGRRTEEITLLAATKTRDAATVREIIACGVTTVGENRVQEMTQKLAQNAYEGAQLHFIGRLQTNKVRQVAGKVALIHSVDSLRLANEINKALSRLREQDASVPAQDVLVEVNIGGELSKGGIEPQDLPAFLEQLAGLDGLRVRGLMCIPPPAETPDEARRYFSEMKALFDRNTHLLAQEVPHILSMGMSDDYEQAILEGSTLVRVGTALFGPRIYT